MAGLVDVTQFTYGTWTGAGYSAGGKSASFVPLTETEKALNAGVAPANDNAAPLMQKAA